MKYFKDLTLELKELPFSDENAVLELIHNPYYDTFSNELKEYLWKVFTKVLDRDYGEKV